MTAIEVCDSTTTRPLPSFDDGATKVVCLSSGEDAHLSVVVDQPGELTVESQGQSIITLPVNKTSSTIPLAEILHRLKRPSGTPTLLSLMSRLGDRSNNPATSKREFTVTVKYNSLPTPTVAATYTFRLVPPSQFATAHSCHLAQVARKRPSPFEFVVDWQLLPSTHCFNCQAEINGATCCTNCGAEQE